MDKTVRENLESVRYHVQLQHRYSAMAAIAKLEESLGGAPSESKSDKKKPSKKEGSK